MMARWWLVEQQQIFNIITDWPTDQGTLRNTYGVNKTTLLSAMMLVVSYNSEELCLLLVTVIHLKFYDILLSEDSWPIQQYLTCFISNVVQYYSSTKLCCSLSDSLQKLFWTMNCFAAFSIVSNYRKNIKFLMNMGGKVL